VRPESVQTGEVDREIVSGPGAPQVASIDDLSVKHVYARKDSSAWQSLLALNEQLKAKGRPPVAIQEVPESLEARFGQWTIMPDWLPPKSDPICFVQANGVSPATAQPADMWAYDIGPPSSS